MAPTVAVLTLHGMGDTKPDYYAELRSQLKKKLGKAWTKVAFEPVYYQDVLQGPQVEIFTRMREHIDWMALRKFMLYGFSDAATLEYRREDPGSPYEKTQRRILEAMQRLLETCGPDCPVVAVAQSLGGQVLSNYLWDAQSGTPSAGVWVTPQVPPGSPADSFLRIRTLERLFTTGCNIPLFVSGRRKIVAIDKPTSTFKWTNCYDEDDVLGWPLQPLSPSYEALVEDVAVNAGGGALGTILKSWNPASHGQYWTDGEVISRIVAAIKERA